MSEIRTTEAQQPIEHAGTVGQAVIDARNLELYAEFFREYEWEPREMSWTVPERTLREIAQRIRTEPQYHQQFKLSVAEARADKWKMNYESENDDKKLWQSRAQSAESKLTAMSAILEPLKALHEECQPNGDRSPADVYYARVILRDRLFDALPELLRVMER